jgi:hypothetical protein
MIRPTCLPGGFAKKGGRKCCLASTPELVPAFVTVIDTYMLLLRDEAVKYRNASTTGIKIDLEIAVQLRMILSIGGDEAY